MSLLRTKGTHNYIKICIPDLTFTAIMLTLNFSFYKYVNGGITEEGDILLHRDFNGQDGQLLSMDKIVCGRRGHI